MMVYLFSGPTPPNADFKLLSSKTLSDAQMAVTNKPVSFVLLFFSKFFQS